MSNPVRQSLYTHADAAYNQGVGKPKSIAARDHLLEIRPDANCKAVCLDVPMPGHGRYGEDEVRLRSGLRVLEELVCSHHVVMLLTDSRESRYIAALMSHYRNQTAEPRQLFQTPPSSDLRGEKSQTNPFLPALPLSTPPLCVCVAVGFDSLVVIRHSYFQGPPLACYFCNDITAPTDTLTNRTLDQQCTVSRSGVSSLSCSLAAELVASLTQHPQGFAAAHSTGNLQEESGEIHSSLGGTPHTIRASVSDYRIVCVRTEPFAQCICCSQPILKAYESNPLQFVKQALYDSAYLERVSGLEQMKLCIREDDVLAFDEDDEGFVDDEENNTDEGKDKGDEKNKEGEKDKEEEKTVR
eukprot:GHVQ01036746.1.p1 GENE.GHVQ01036746.1~~GHVQ01036746.1.p1  ORF type:complete len:390 (+),score=71.85 GHVQ01036746.1:108-1172(+)